MGKVHPKKPKTYRDGQGTTYCRRNKKTGVITSAQLCHPNNPSTEKQQANRTKFGLQTKAVCKWIDENKSAETEIYKKVMAKFKRQDQFKLLRGYMLGKGMAVVQPDGTVVITIDDYSVNMG